MLLLVLAEALLFYAQIAVTGGTLSSIYFWSVLILISGPTTSGITLYREAATSSSGGASNVSLTSLSYVISTMILVANATIATVILIFLMQLR